MGRIPKQPREVFDLVANDLERVYGTELESVVLYGSGARGDYQPGRSDLNFLVVLSEQGIGNLAAALPLLRPWLRRRITTPLFLTQAYIASSLDTFPIEFLTMRSAYEVVRGRDPLADLRIEPQHVRWQCEHECKGKLLQLREGFLASGRSRRAMQQLVACSLPAFFSLFQAILYVRGESPEADRQRLLERMQQLAGLNGGVFTELLSLRAGRQRGSRARLQKLLQCYITEIRRLALFVDALDVPAATPTPDEEAP